MNKGQAPSAQQISELLYRFDPVRLRAIGCPPDEYDGEAEQIVKGLEACRSLDEVDVLVRNTFTSFFDAHLVADVGRQWTGLAAALWRLRDR